MAKTLKELAKENNIDISSLDSKQKAELYRRLTLGRGNDTHQSGKLPFFESARKLRLREGHHISREKHK